MVKAPTTSSTRSVLENWKNKAQSYTPIFSSPHIRLAGREWGPGPRGGENRVERSCRDAVEDPGNPGTPHR